MLEVSNRALCDILRRRATWPLTEQSGRSLVASCQRVDGTRPSVMGPMMSSLPMSVATPSSCFCPWSTSCRHIMLSRRGGAAVTADKYDIFDVATGALFSSARETRWGGTVGAGFEYGFAPNWSVGIEYDHLFMGNRNISFTTPGGIFDGTDRIRQDVDMGLVRLNYRFAGFGGFGAPVAARY
jgi:hypothetical protein